MPSHDIFVLSLRYKNGDKYRAFPEDKEQFY